ncbi:MAG: hypothetical protein MJ211_12600 [Bacteroidales bacterium]|nr:hypothetical protein [Bacteroidales bacterium]
MKKFFILSALLIISFYSWAQDLNQNNNGRRQIEIINTNTLEGNEFYGPDIKILRGDVQFYHDSSFMYCDSAFYNSKQNFFQAFGKFHIIRLLNQGVDTVHLWSDSANYDGNLKLAKARSNVKMTKDSMVMLTQFLDFDMANNVAQYFDGGVTYSGEDSLTSEFAYFYPETDDLKYTKDVIIHDPEYKMYSDLLNYNVKTKISSFNSPTRVEGEDLFIYSELGWYNHNNDVCELTKNSYIKSQNRQFNADTIYYDRKINYGEGKSNVIIVDTTQDVKFTGNMAKYFDDKQRSILTDKALIISYSDIDTIYIHADTILTYMEQYPNYPDSLYRMVKAYNHVKMFRPDIQTMCDSMVYNFSDSIIYMYKNPVIWHKENQITADNIVLYTVNNRIDMAELTNSAFVIAQVDSIRFNQIFGSNMVAYLDSNKIREVEVISNANTIYYTQEDSVVTGMNEISSQDMNIIFDNGKVSKIWFYKNPKGIVHPLELLNRSQEFIEGFIWYDNHRPRSKNDVFIWNNLTEKGLSIKELQQKEEEERLAKEELENE